MSEPVLLRIEGAIARLSFNRPKHRNALDVASAEAFLAGVRRIAETPSVRAVVVSGEGSAFGAGGDLNEFPTTRRLAFRR